MIVEKTHIRAQSQDQTKVGNAVFVKVTPEISKPVSGAESEYRSSGLPTPPS